MASKLLCLIALSLASISTNAQISIRPQVGINFPKLTKEIQEGKFEGNVGYQFGADVQIGLAGIYLQPGLNFETAKLQLEDVGDIQVGRINIPVLLGFRFLNPNKTLIGLRAYLGPNFAINVSEDLDDAFSYIDEEHIRKAQVEGVFGVGADVSIVFIDVAYKLAFSEFFDKDVDSDSKLSMFFVNAGIRIGFGN